MYISKYSTKKARRRVTAGEEIDAPVETNAVEEDFEEPVEDIEIDPAATELVFETEDVAQLIAEITEDTVSVEADENAVIFTVGDADYTVEPEGDEEILETSRKVLKGKKAVSASTRTRKPARKPATRRATRKIGK